MTNQVPAMGIENPGKTLSKSLIATMIVGVFLTFLAGCAAHEGASGASVVPDGGRVVGETRDLEQAEKSGAATPNRAAADSSTVFAPLSPDGKTVARVEPIRYLGKWYEIATIPIVFQLLCTGSTAEYAYVDESTISVRNECALGTLRGPRYAVDGYARIVNSASKARLSVSFGKAPTDFGAPYWVIELDGSEKNGPYEKYEWALVGGPTKNNLWILSRTPQLDERRLELLLDRLAERGYDLNKLKFTTQPKS
jgi:apolipoprotein D and lipocalin family protein